MTRDAEPDLRELITARRGELEVQAEKLSQQLQEVRDELRLSARYATTLLRALLVLTNTEFAP